MKKMLWWGYLVALHVAVAALALDAQVPHRAMVKLGLAQEPDWSGIEEARAVQRRMDPQVPAGAVIFVGDSHTQMLVTAAVAPVSVNFGIAGQRSDQLLTSMAAYASMQRAAAVVITIGTNDILQGRRDGLDARYRAILAKVPAGIPVVLAGVPPMTGTDVRAVVAEAQTACAAHARCSFVDPGVAVTPEMLVDGVHLSPAGYAALVSLLREALKKNAPGLSEPRA